MRFCYVGHVFHKKTRSNGFFLDLLKDLGSVTEFYSSPDDEDSGNDQLILEIARGSYDAYVFWQTEYIAQRLLPFGLGRFILVPMWDGAEGRSVQFWRQFTTAQFISFSRVHHEQLQQSGLRSAYFRYFPKPDPRPHDFTGPLSAFFWERTPGVEPTLHTVADLCAALGISSLHVHLAPDRAAQRALASDRWTMRGVGITVSKWFEDRNELDNLMAASQFAFAPRALEGIGMSFLEPMARGQIVVAPNRPTMNEYIRHGTNGLLFNIDEPGVDLAPPRSALAEMSSAALRTVARGHSEWLADQPRLRSILLDDGQRWLTTDFSSHFHNEIRRRASERAAGRKDSFATSTGER